MFSFCDLHARQVEIHPVNFPINSRSVSLYEYAQVSFTYEKTESIPGNFFKLNFQPLNKIFEPGNLNIDKRIQNIWFRFKVRNILLEDSSVALVFPGAVNKATLYKKVNGKLELIGKTGFAISVMARNISYDEFRIDISLKARESAELYLQVPRIGFDYMLSQSPALESLDSVEQRALNKEVNIVKPGLLWSHFFAGLFCMFFVFGAVKYLVSSKDKAYLYYSLLGLFSALLTFAYSEYPPLELPGIENIRGLELFELYNSAAVLMQGLFMVEILKLNSTSPRIAGIIKWLLISRVIITFLFILSWSFEQGLPVLFWWTIMFYHLIFIAIMILCAYYLLKRNKGFYRYILFGNLTIVVSLVAVFLVRFFDVHDIFPNWFSADRRSAPFHLIQIALFVDMVFYFAGLAFRDKQMEKDKLSFQQQYGESELKALRSQMNPHFIFNVLNTIESYTLQHNKEAASAAIQKFSRLTRIVLENSRNSLVSFDHDLYALKLYVELEQLRYEKKFITIYNIDETLLNGNYAVPPMIIQPFVENAIIHGLRNKKNGKGRLVISATSEMNGLLVVITDNGIGRKEAGHFKSASGMFRESLGIRFTQDRIAMYNSTTGKKSIAEIVDLEEGTQVSILFPQGP